MKKIRSSVMREALEANKRMEGNGNNRILSFDSVMSNLGISEDELLDTEDVGIE